VRRVLPIFAALLCALGAARAQEQEQGMLDRIDANWKQGIQAMNADATGKKKGKDKTAGALVSPLTSKKFESSEMATKSFSASSFSGVKGAPIKSYETRSFFGLRNPWFGRKVFDTTADTMAGRSARESREQFKTDAFAVKEFEKASKGDAQDASATLATADQPRPYLVPGKTQQGLDKFTQNLKKDLTIDDVRDLLNKGTDK